MSIPSYQLNHFNLQQLHRLLVFQVRTVPVCPLTFVITSPVTLMGFRSMGMWLSASA